VASIGAAIERKLDDLQARLDPTSYGSVMELLQSITDLYGSGLARMLELTDLHAPELTARLVADDLLASLLIGSGLHPDELEMRIHRALDAVRPFLAGHGGDVELLDVDEHAGAVRLRLLGSCDGCPSSAITLRSTVERAIMEAAPEIGLIDVEEPAQLDTSTPIALGQKPVTMFDPATGCGAAQSNDESTTSDVAIR
jgi:Fe-S cluster biogenesis protein NfuA